jgi:hypothetical protein
LFHTSGEIAALDWLNIHATPDTLVLSTMDISNYLPARTSLRAYIGHGPETINLGAKRALVDSFLAGKMTEDQQQTFLQDNFIRYVIVPPGIGPLTVPGLTEIYEGDGYLIYENALMG